MTRPKDATVERIENPFRGALAGRARHEGGAPAVEAPRRGKGPPAPALDLPLRAMTGYEEEVVERRGRDANTTALCNEIVARCTLAPGADPAPARERVRALLVAERDVALIAIRRMSFGDLVELEVACPACGKKNEIDFQLGALPIALGPIQREIDTTLPDGTPVAMRTPTAGDQEDLVDADLETESERRTFLLGRTIVRFGDREGPFDFAFARALPVSARNALERALEAAIPDLDLSMTVTCSVCGHAFSAPFDVASFFLPS